jgi:hypothetical protein
VKTFPMFLRHVRCFFVDHTNLGGGLCPRCLTDVRHYPARPEERIERVAVAMEALFYPRIPDFSKTMWREVAENILETADK